MKATLVLPLVVTLAVVTFALTAPAFAQSPDLQTAEAACGPGNVHFETQTSSNQPLPHMEDGKSLVYVVEIFVANDLARPTLRVGIDGKWAGAVKSSSYLSFSVDPGEHHLCTNWQSHLKHFSQKAAFTSFTADAGRTYYFRAHIIESGGPGGSGDFTLDLDPVNEDEGKYLVASNSLAVSHAK